MTDNTEPNATSGLDPKAYKDTVGLPSDRAGLVAWLNKVYDRLYSECDLAFANEIGGPIAEAIAALSRATEAVAVKPLELERRTAGEKLAEAVFGIRLTPTTPAPQPALALIEELEELHSAEHAKLGQMLLDKSEEGIASANWQGGKVNGIATALASAKRFKTGG